MQYFHQQEVLLKSMLRKEKQLQKDKRELQTALETQSFKTEDFRKLEEQIEGIRQMVDTKMVERDQQIGVLNKEIETTEIKSSSVKQWIEEMKEKFTPELGILKDHNIQLQISCSALKNRVLVLEIVEKQLMNSESEEIEVDGVFVSSAAFTNMMDEVAQAGHNMWDMIQRRLLTVM